MSKNFKIGLVGATGVVGEKFIQLLKENNFPVEELRPFASERSAGLKIDEFNCEIQTLKEGCFVGLDFVFFSSGDDISLEWAPKAAAAGAYAIDNSAAFRMNPEHSLVVPEVNSNELKKMNSAEVIANPNCSTIQLMLPLNALKEFGVNKVRVASYQAVSGAGKQAITELTQQTSNLNLSEHQPGVFPKPIAYNCIPQIGSFNDDDFTSEEFKIMNESKKILSLPDLKISAFTVRVPSLNTHAEAVWVTLDKNVSREEIIAAFKKQEGLTTFENPRDYDTPRDCNGKYNVSVSRIHKDLAEDNTWILWVVGDNLLKGAALNGFQIAQKLVELKKV